MAEQQPETTVAQQWTSTGVGQGVKVVRRVGVVVVVVVVVGQGMRG